MVRMRNSLFLGVLALFLALNMSPSAFAQNRDMQGWEADGEYNKHYDMSEFDSFKCKVVDIEEVVPLPGMAPAVALVVKDSDDEEILVHLGPVWFVKNHGIRKGDKLRIRGAWAEIDGREVFMAAKVKRGDEFSYKVRLTKDGTPFWTLSDEQLAQERMSD